MIKTLVTLFIVSTALGANTETSTPVYDMQLRISVKDQILTPRIISRAGQKATMMVDSNTKGKYFVEAIATESDKTAVMMNFTVGTIDQDGKKTILTSPKILTQENEAAAIIQSDEATGEKLSLGVVVSRQ